MWIVRELTRLLEKIAIAVVVALVVAELRTLISGGDRTSRWASIRCQEVVAE